VTDEFLPGFRNSAASYTVSLLQPKVIHDMQLERHGLKVVLRKTDNFLPADGDYLLAGRGGLTRKEIGRHHKADAEAYDRYHAELETVVRLLKKWLLRAPPNVGRTVSAIPKLLSLGRDMAGLSLAETRIVHDFAVRSAADILDRHFAGDLAKALFGFDGVVGNFASPQSPGTGYVLLHHLFGEAAGVPGAWGHAIGGMGSITQAMARACREAGVDILLGHPVEEVIVNGGRAVGAVAGGKAWRAAIVVAGVNPKLLFDRLIPSTVDDSLAPPGKHVASLFCQHFRYALPDGRGWDAERERAADAIIAQVTKFAPNFRSAILARRVLSPLDLEREFSLVGGDIFHGKLALNQLFSARPALGYGNYRMPLKGLYLCGSGAHPGGGVTGIPGHNAAREVLRDL
jgi:phytoene dehydrogenase-like protein